MTETKGTKISSYKLPVKTQESTREGFGGVTKKQWYSLAEIQSGDYSGTTESDSKTDPKGSGGYSKINQKSGGNIDAPGKKLGMTVKLDKNTRLG